MRLLIFSIFGMLLILAVYAGFLCVVEQRNRVRNSAQLTAGDQPFCVQVPAGDALYKQAESWIDLTIFVMRGNGAPHHGVLIVGSVEDPELFHWSYWKQSFIKGILGPQPIYCNPRAKFLETPNSESASDFTHVNFYMGGQYFSIPKAYAPEPNWVDGFSLRFGAQAPAFEPAQTAFINSRQNNRVKVAFYPKETIPNWPKIPVDAADIESLADDYESDKNDNYGLEKRTSRSATTGLPNGGAAYFQRSPEGDVTTIIRCSERADVQCSHSFEDDGWVYEFHHLPAEIPEWQAMQDRLVKLTDSFVLAN